MKESGVGARGRTKGMWNDERVAEMRGGLLKVG